MTEGILNKIERVYDMFPTSFIHNGEELILDKKLNVYFRLPDVKTVYDFDYKLLSYCSFYTSDSHFKPTSKTSKYFHNRINRWFRKDFSREEIQRIYQKLGCGANRSLGIEFIKSDCDMEGLR